MSTVSRVVEALPQELRTHKAILTFKQSGGVKCIRRWTRAAIRYNPRLISEYLTANTVRKLHLGCGYHRIAAGDSATCPRRAWSGPAPWALSFPWRHLTAR